MNKPLPGEYGELPGNYVKLMSGEDDILAALARQRDLSYGFFSNLSSSDALYAYAPGKWTVKEMLGHMIDTERTFAYRAMAFARGTEELPGFDQDLYMENSTYNQQNIRDLAGGFKLLRDANLYLFRSFTCEQEVRAGIASGYKISVRALVCITAGHERHHYNILRERYKLNVS